MRRTTRQIKVNYRAVFECLQQLEPRRLYSAAQMPLIQRAPGDVVDQSVWAVVQTLQGVARGAPANLGAARLDAQDRIQLDIQFATKPDVLVRALKQFGAQVTENVGEIRTVEAWVPAAAVSQIAAMSNVEAVRLPVYVYTNVTSDGDGILNADDVRSQFAAMGIDGTGIKVGVISNGVNHKANVGAELPTVTVDPAHPGSGDEGTAMLEIVHDLAPGAQLFFSGITSSTQMIPAIDYLVGQGCNVILDDLSFFGEGYFTDTGIAQHVDSVITSNNVVYVTSSGNYSDGAHYQAPYFAGSSLTGDGRLHRFGGLGEDVDHVLIPNGTTFTAFLEWSDPWGGSSNNYNLYLYQNDATIFQLRASGVNVQDGQVGDLPFEAVQWLNNTGATVQAELWVEKKNTAAARELEMFTINQNPLEFSTAGDALIGQEAVANVISVATANAGSPSSVTDYSSRGGSTIYSNFTTQTKSIRNSLDGTAIDGVQTKVGQLGFFSNPFFGTSAASPHAGAIAALIRQVNPALTPTQVAQIMADTATDLTTYGVGYDSTSGAGRYNALDAVYKAFTPTAPDLDAGSDLGPSSTDNITKDTTPTFTGTAPAASFVRLFVDGVQNQSVQLAAGVTSYNLTTTALGSGGHNISIRVASGSAVSLTNNSNTSVSLPITIDITAPIVSTKTFNYGATQQSITYAFNESVSGSVDNTDLNLLNTITGIPLSSGSIVGTVSPSNTARFTFPGLPFGAVPDGQYTSTLGAGLVTDLAGNALALDSAFNFFFIQGDANHNGAVDATDLGILSLNWQQQPRTFSQGDFTYNGVVDVNDLSLLASRWQGNILAVSSPVPPQFAQEAIGDRHDDLLELLA